MVSDRKVYWLEDSSVTFDDYDDALEAWRTEETADLIHVTEWPENDAGDVVGVKSGHPVGGCLACRDDDLAAQWIGA